MISIVIPVRNRAKIVMRTLESVGSQTVAPREVIVVDNASTDNTLEVVRAWARGRDNVKVLTEAQPGAARARNTGLAAASGRYVMFFDSDDYMPPRHVEELQRAIVNASYPRLLAFDMDLVDLRGRVLHKAFRRGDAMSNHIFHSTISTLRCIMQASLAREVGGWNATLRGWDDWEFGIRLLKAAGGVEYVRLSEPVVAYAQAESITGTDFSSKRGEWEAALAAADATLAGTPRVRLIDYRRAILAGTYRREGHPEYARGMVKGLWLRLIEQYVALGGRGVALLAHTGL